VPIAEKGHKGAKACGQNRKVVWRQVVRPPCPALCAVVVNCTPLNYSAAEGLFTADYDPKGLCPKDTVKY
jgi:hypothetical protein